MPSSSAATNKGYCTNPSFVILILSSLLYLLLLVQQVTSMSTTTPKHELIYFPIPARAGAARIAFASAGIPFTDTRLDFSTDYQEAKKAGKYPTGLPVLKVGDDKEYLQSTAILRYAGKLSGLYPTDDHLTAMEIDQVIDIAEDINNSIPDGNGTDEDKKLKREEYCNGKMKTFFSQIEHVIERNGNGPFVLGKDPTIADFHLKYLIIRRIEMGILDHIPKVRVCVCVCVCLREFHSVLDHSRFFFTDTISFFFKLKTYLDDNFPKIAALSKACEEHALYKAHHKEGKI